ncbi:hypothetical protein SLEP1_g12613 [Rubroshorea leprosula]|uniref:Uncharacterized protein n=1 Tax=Rubroshorea leprosula TaxID=152421 RepID=A0AAV5ID46_9ROSI|nr:hypothetical protein SLEP1_g12613 [Rubroshorea leprosula]
MGRGTRGESSSKEASNTLDKAQKQLRCLIHGPRKATPTQQQMPSSSQPPSQQQLPTFEPASFMATPPLPDQELGDEAPMEEDAEELVEERNLEVELVAEYDQLDPELDAALEEELSHAIQKTGRGMDKGDKAPANPSQRKLLKINQRGSFSNERFGRQQQLYGSFYMMNLCFSGLIG